MEGFNKNYTKSKRNIKSADQLDDYEKKIKKSSDKRNKLQTMALNQQGNIQSQFSYMNRSYAIVIFGLISGGLSYPISVKIVKKVFKLKSFFNIHFAILPIMANINAVTLGCAQGIINGINFNSNYPIQTDNNTGLNWKNML